MTIFVGTKLQNITNATTVGVANTYYTIHTFSTPGTTSFTVQGSGLVDVLVVGGGGLGGGTWLGGGAGGSVAYARNIPLIGGVSYPITVGSAGNPGGSSTFNYNGGSITVSGGVQGGGRSNGISNPLGSGSGGGWGGGSGGTGANVIGLGFPGLGEIGGTGRGGGGGGAGGAAIPGTGIGGAGVRYSIRGTSESFGGGGPGTGFPLNPDCTSTDFGLGGDLPNPGCIIIRYIS
jgi:hypothetical protein